jgi:hypothetical protein
MIRASIGAGAALLALAVAASALTPRTAGAQQVAYAAVTEAELDSTTRVAVAREIDRARERGLPVAPLMAKVREGKLKRAPGARIRVAVSALAVRLDTARGALGPAATSDELVAAADALAAGAGPDALRAIASSAATRSLAAPLGSLAQLVASGVAPRRAVEMITTLMRRHAAPAAVLAFGNQVEADVISGMPAEEAAIFRLKGIEAAIGGADATTVSAPALSGAVSGQQRGSSPPRRRP